MLPADSAEIIERTIRAAVEQHFLDLKSSIDQDLGNFDSHQGDTAQPAVCLGEHQKNTDQKDTQDALGRLEEGSGMELDAVRDTENNIGAASADDQPGDATHCDSSCDQNANTSQMLSSGHAPHIQLFPDHQWDDPVPAFKSWQDDSESGEAQLSPLAGRMVPLPLLPLEEDDGDEGGGEGGGEDASPSSSRSHPHLLARRFLDFGVHGAQRFLQQDADATSPTKAHRPRRASFGSKEVLRGGDSVTHQLTKKLQHLKKKIKQFEEQFEKEKNYKPSHGDKAANTKVLKWMTDLTKIRRQIKDAKQRAESDLGPQTRPRSNTLPKSFGSSLEQTSTPHPTREETMELIQRRVSGKRQEDGWPDDIKKMTKEQLSCEKTVLQKNLLHYEGLHGRPVTREERLVVKPLYERYRLIKQMLTRVTITPVTVSPSSKRRSQMLQPIIEGETAHFWEEIKEEEEGEERVAGEKDDANEEDKKKEEEDYNEEDEEEDDEEEEEEEGESSGGEMQSSEVIMAMEMSTTAGGSMRAKMEEGSGKMALDLRLSSSNASSMPELLEQLWKARAEKKKLRKTIREFEEEFYQRNGRNVQKEDREPMLDEYRAYKRLKAKLRLLEVLISKQDSSKSI